MSKGLNLNKFITKFGDEFAGAGEKEIVNLLENSGVKISEGKILGKIGEDGKTVTAFKEHKDVFKHFNDTTLNRINAQAGESATSVNRLEELRAKFGTINSKSVANGPRDTSGFDKFSESEIKKLRKEQHAQNIAKGDGSHGTSNLSYAEMKQYRDLNSPDTWNTPNVKTKNGNIPETGLPRNPNIGPHSPHGNFQQSLEREAADLGQEGFNKAIYDMRNSGVSGNGPSHGPYTASKTERNVTDYSVFNDAQKMNAYVDKHGIKNITNDQAIKANQLKENITKKIKDGTAGAAAAEKNNAGKMDSFLRQAVPITVGGGLVFSMFNRGGQMSNSELYGQSGQYGY